MLTNPSRLPAPDDNMLDHSNMLLQLIKQEIFLQGGAINFARFMELALYAPALGYYSAGAQKFGADGDFVTAPEISPLFANCIARQCQQVLMELKDGNILEFGAGSGNMAAALLLELERLECLPIHYFILEISADLRWRQQQLLRLLIPNLYQRVIWLTALPIEPLQGVIIANEVLDAMPVQRFQLENEQIWELGVAWENDQLIWQKISPANPALIEAITHLQYDLLTTVPTYISEINLTLTGWLQSISDKLAKGLILIIDYGFPSTEYYHLSRWMGTLMCHYRHYTHPDPFWLPGLQDITAHVDFTAVAEAAHRAGLTISGYTTQAAFLLATGLLTFIEAAPIDNQFEQITISQQIQKLTSSHEMGDLFKVLALTKEFTGDLIGFSLQNHSARL